MNRATYSMTSPPTPQPKQWNRFGYAANRQRRRGVVVEGTAAHQTLAPLRQLDTTCRHDRLDRVALSKGRNVKASAAGELHSSTPAANSVVVSTSGVGAAR